MPDLILWQPAARRAMLVEVKGPTDRLSEQQCAWLATLSAAGLEVGARTRAWLHCCELAALVCVLLLSRHQPPPSLSLSSHHAQVAVCKVNEPPTGGAAKQRPCCGA